MKLKSLIFSLIIVSYINAQDTPVKINTITKYHFQIKNTSRNSLKVYLGNDAGETNAEKKTYLLSAGESKVFLKSKFPKKRGPILQIINSVYEPVLIWDFIEKGGKQITHHANLGIGFILGKSELNDFWEAKGNNLQWDFHYSISLLPEIRLSNKLYSRFFLSADHERITHKLRYNNPVFLKSDYVENPSLDYYEIIDKENISLNLRYSSLGIFNRLYIVPFGYFDFGIKVPVLKNSFVDFRDSDNEKTLNVLRPRAQITDAKVRNNLNFENSTLEDIIYFVKFGFTPKNKNTYTPLISGLSLGVGLYFMNPNVTPTQNFPLAFDNQENNVTNLEPIPTEANSDFYYMISFQIKYLIGK